MRIDGPGNRPNINRTRKGTQSGSGGGFSVSDETASRGQASMASAGQAARIDSILALQTVEDPLFSRKKAVRHGQSMLDTLEEMKADLLLGRISEGRLNRLMALVTRARPDADPNLKALIDDIELRARVELAKLGRYAN